MDDTTVRRYSLLDAVRGAAVLNMIAYHLLYNIYCVFGVWPEFYQSAAAVIWERFICVTFIVVSGMAINFSRRGYRRGIIISLCGIIVTVVTVIFIPEQMIMYGILTFLGFAMLVTFALRDILGQVKPAIGAAVSFALFALSYGVPFGYLGFFSVPIVTLPETMYRYRWLAFLGFRNEAFFSADYFPILPWIFLFVFGFYLWRLIAEHDLDRFFYKKIPVLDFFGRHSLIIYMIHQPILYGLCYLVFTYMIK